jgi:hypothetical protein
MIATLVRMKEIKKLSKLPRLKVTMTSENFPTKATFYHDRHLAVTLSFCNQLPFLLLYIDISQLMASCIDGLA